MFLFNSLHTNEGKCINNTTIAMTSYKCIYSSTCTRKFLWIYPLHLNKCNPSASFKNSQLDTDSRKSVCLEIILILE